MKFGASNWYHYEKHRDAPIHNGFLPKSVDHYTSEMSNVFHWFRKAKVIFSNS